MKIWSVWAVWGRCNNETEARHIRAEAEKHYGPNSDMEFRIAIFPNLEDRKYVVQFRQVEIVCDHNVICATAAECMERKRPCGHRLGDADPCCRAAGTRRIIEDSE